jgi:diguanylate cyclase (GGDEF)-like protein
VLRALRSDPNSKATAEDAIRLRDALVAVLERSARGRPGGEVERVRALVERLQRFPSPTGIERQLGQVLLSRASGRGRPDPRPAVVEPRPAPEPEPGGPAPEIFGDLSALLLTLANQVAVPAPDMVQGLERLQEELPEPLDADGADAFALEVRALLTTVGPVRRRFEAAQRECSALLKTLARQLNQSHQTGARIASRAELLAQQLSEDPDPSAIRVLRADLLRGLDDIRSDTRQLQSSLTSSEQRIADLEAELDLRNLELNEARRAAEHDPLTGTLNRSGFDRRLERHMTRSRQSGEPLSLLMLDLDHFKSLNDTYGHPAGDKVLRSVARTLERQLRVEDLVGRLGGEEFAVMLPRNDPREAARIADRLREAIASKVFVSSGRRFSVTTSIGVTTYRPGEGAHAMLERADKALYRAKEGGRNQVISG